MPKPSQTTVGYPHLEKLIDSEDFGEINRTFLQAYKHLEKISKEKKGLRVQKEAKKAMTALEKVAELLKELLHVKYRLQEQAQKQGKKS